MAKKKELIESPYINYSVEEICAAEAGNYVIQIGGDFFSYNGKIGFSRKRAEMFYDDVWGGLKEMKKTGSETEKTDAQMCLLNLRIYPLRIH